MSPRITRPDRIRRWLLAAASFAVAVASRPAAAGEPAKATTVTILPVETEGVDSGFAQAMNDALRTGVERGEVTLMPSEAIESALQGAERCDDACIARVFSGGAADIVVRARVEASDRTFAIELDALSERTATPVASVSESCEICGKREVMRSLEDAGAALAVALASRAAAAPVLKVSTQPPGARVLVDGEFLGTTPLEAAIEPGAHEVAIEREGYVRQIQTLDAVPGVQSWLQLSLQERSLDPAELERQRRRSKIFVVAGSATLAAGVGLMATGIPLVVIDSTPIRRNCSGQNVDVNGTCRYSHDTIGVGISGLVVGGAAAITGATLVVLGVVRRPDPETSARVRIDRRGLTLRF